MMDSLQQLHTGSGVAAPRLWSTGLVIVASGLRRSVACGIFQDQGSNPLSPALAGGFFTTEPPGALWQLSYPSIHSLIYSVTTECLLHGRRQK